ncbi:MAG: rhodanese-like domain-containing protein [Planctomycetota bacterium]|nr:MAG: rhodanese-like domain-containing protein [Planctomycetota bacterium]
MERNGKKLGLLLASIFGIGMLFLPDYRHTFPIRTEELALDIAQGRDHFSPNTLKKWVIAGKKNFLVIDIRDPKDFQASHIPDAWNIPLATLGKREVLRKLPSDIPIIVYSHGGIHGAQAWVLLKSAGKKAYFLEGGYRGWQKVMRGEKWRDMAPPQRKIYRPTGATSLPLPKAKEEEEGC